MFLRLCHSLVILGRTVNTYRRKKGDGEKYRIQLATRKIDEGDTEVIRTDQGMKAIKEARKNTETHKSAHKK